LAAAGVAAGSLTCPVDATVADSVTVVGSAAEAAFAAVAASGRAGA
jgi:hypothetical protein